MKTAVDCPFPVAWTSDELADAVPRRVSALFAAAITPPGMTAGPDGVPRRNTRRLLDRGLPTLFRVR